MDALEEAYQRGRDYARQIGASGGTRAETDKYTEICYGVAEMFKSKGLGNGGVDPRMFKWHNELVSTDPDTPVQKILDLMESGVFRNQGFDAAVQDLAEGYQWNISREYSYPRFTLYEMRQKVEGLLNARAGDKDFDSEVESLIATEIKAKYPTWRKNSKQWRETHDRVLGQAQDIVVKNRRQRAEYEQHEINRMAKESCARADESIEKLGYWREKAAEVLALRPGSPKAQALANAVAAKEQELQEAKADMQQKAVAAGPASTLTPAAPVAPIGVEPTKVVSQQGMGHQQAAGSTKAAGTPRLSR